MLFRRCYPLEQSFSVYRNPLSSCENAGLDSARDSAFLTNFQVRLLLLVWDYVFTYKGVEIC